MELFSNHKLLLVLPDISFYVEIITNRPVTTSALYQSGSARLKDFPGLSRESLGIPEGFIYPSNGTSTSRDFLGMLEKKLLEELSMNPDYVLEFEDPKDLEQVYLISHGQASYRTRRFLNESSISLFRFNLEELIGNRQMTYIKQSKKMRFSLLQEHQFLKAQNTQINQVFQSTLVGLEQQKVYSRNIKTDFELTKMNAQNLNSQLEKYSVQCEFCRERKKDILVAPCFHVVGCAECIRNWIPISEYGVPVRHSVCILCNTPVTEIRQIYHS